MRVTLLGLILYSLFLLQSLMLLFWSVQAGPDLILLTLIVAALHESRIVATALGLFAGLCLDLTTPTLLGANMLALGFVGYAAAAARRYFYPARWFMFVLALAGLSVRWSVLWLAGAKLPQALLLATSAALTVALSPLIEILVVWLCYRHRETA